MQSNIIPLKQTMLKKEEEKVRAYPLVTEKTVKRRNSIVPFL
jgi:hypothetical protein